MRINASKTKVTPALIPGKQLDDETNSRSSANGQSTDEIKSELALFLDIGPMRYWQEMMVAYQITEITRISNKHNVALCILTKA